FTTPKPSPPKKPRRTGRPGNRSPMSMLKRIARHGLTLIATALLGGLLSAALVRLAPGFDVDEQQLDPHLNSASVQALRRARAEQYNILRFYLHSLQRAAHGDL